MKLLTMIVVAALISSVAGGCSQGDAQKDKTYHIMGKVVSVDVAKKSVKLDHEDIPGYMKAMEMNFEVTDAKLLEGLKAGDQVHGKLKVQSEKGVITELKKQ